MNSVSKNTCIEYLYRDADNYKKWSAVVLKGLLTKEQTEVILDCLEAGEYFIPESVGLPEIRFDEWDPEVDHPWFELGEWSFSELEAEPTVSITPATLGQAFLENKGRWLENTLAS